MGAAARVDVELLVVPGCPNASAAHELLRASLDAAGLAGVPVRVSVIDSQAAAEQRGFVGSPTFLIDGRDPFAEPGRPAALACRMYPGASGPARLPAPERLEAALAQAAAVPRRS